MVKKNSLAYCHFNKSKIKILKWEGNPNLKQSIRSET